MTTATVNVAALMRRINRLINAELDMASAGSFDHEKIEREFQKSWEALHDYLREKSK